MLKETSNMVRIWQCSRDLGLFEISASSQGLTGYCESWTDSTSSLWNVNQGSSLTFQCNFLPLVTLSMESRWPDSHIVQHGSHTVADLTRPQSDNGSTGLLVFTQCFFSFCPQNSLSKQMLKKNPKSHRFLSISQWICNSHRLMTLSQCKFKTGKDKGCFCWAQDNSTEWRPCMCFKPLLMGRVRPGSTQDPSG